jgi:hypothetical protein
MIVGWPGLGGLAAAFRGRRKGTRGRTRLAQLGLLALLAASVLVGFSGCGGSSSVTPQGSSAILITATPSGSGSGSLASQTLSLTLTITQ